MFRRQINAGMRLLDKAIPGWEKSIDVDRLNLANGIHQPRGECGCVLAQIDWVERYDQADGYEGYFDDGLGLVGLDHDSAVDKGFDVSSPQRLWRREGVPYSKAYRILTEEWQEKLAERGAGQ